ncbi:hypothetical protein HYFRA_00005564 [Hymenoscyphus fraxineus]|uniref:DUF221-domain-containing protein n=1 Tax=Hymenoscyphus fraxineus TaxID=746836 RepID=A0A9N9KUI4_9HELO|nr:hypothetical protein HYFRA_00005564 [Hymenoscyphus fraxineus]
MSNSTFSLPTSTTMSATPTETSAVPTAVRSGAPGSAQNSQGISLLTFVTALVSSLVIFGVQMFLFILLKNKLARIFKPKTYLVPERERTEAPPGTPWGWLFAIFRFRDREIINKCGLDAYFFLRYLQTLVFIFIPLAVLLLPILLPLNYMDGRGGHYALENGNSTDSKFANVTGLDQVAWGNVRPTHTGRYWAHCILALVVIVWVCAVFFNELRVYIKVRQDYLTSAEHRLRASATTVLVSSIPRKWLSKEALAGLYDVFPGGIRNIWINRNFDELLDKIHEREQVFNLLETAETELVRKAKLAQKKQLERDEKKARRDQRSKNPTKEEKDRRLRWENEAAERLAQSDGGTTTGHPDQVPHTVDDAIDEELQRSANEERSGRVKVPIPIIGNGLAAVGHGLGALGQGIGKGIGAAGNTVVGGARILDERIETTNGFSHIDSFPIQEDDVYDRYGRYRPAVETHDNQASVPENEKPQDNRASVESSQDGRGAANGMMRLPGNTTRHVATNYGGDGANDGVRGDGWWKFWQGPSGGFASPLPNGYEGEDFPLNQTDGLKDHESSHHEPKTGFFSKFISIFDPLRSEKVTAVEYPVAHNEDYMENAVGAVWQKYLKEKDRPTHRLSRFKWTPVWFPAFPLINKKVDTIYWCRGELARLNLEIEMDQKQPERFPLMNSAFIQFNHQVAAHMASQAVTHHIPKQMAPRTVEVSPNDVLWDNMSISWWEAWLRTAAVFVIVAGMIILWAIPVAWTATLSQLAALADEYVWLSWLNQIPDNVLKAVAGVLPAAVLGILLVIVPIILGYLAQLQGAQTGKEKQRSVQNYYFAFLFVQVFLIVSISGGITNILAASAKDITSIPETLATQLPKAANYFFSYMILQALSTASGTLLQAFTLLLWYILPKLFDSTARQKWIRNTTLPKVTWGTLFPVYTNFACIALIYSIVAPIIIIFALITFSLLWIAHRYNMLYVVRFQLDTGGLLYPRAINQTFTGLYVMEICMVGLFFLVRDDKGRTSCFKQAIIMIVAIFLTVIYQFLLNRSFGPLFQHLPITFEDEAVLRDEAFQRAQARRLGLVEEEEDAEQGPKENEGIELSTINKRSHGSVLAKLNPVNIVQGAGNWAMKSGREIKSKTIGQLDGSLAPVRRRRHRDAEARAKIADALYGGINDDIEDLTPEERDILVRHAFQHYALRARRPIVWIPRDDTGVSDDEIKRTRDFAGGNIWISNVGAALDGKARVVYGRNPPDFSEIDIINL